MDIIYDNLDIIIWWGIIPITLLCIIAGVSNIITRRRKRARKDCAEYDRLMSLGYEPMEALLIIVAGELKEDEPCDCGCHYPEGKGALIEGKACCECRDPKDCIPVYASKED